MNVLTELQDAYLNNQLIPVLGSGLSIPFRLPSWGQLIQMAAERFIKDEQETERVKALSEKYEYLKAIDVILDQGIAENQLLNFVASAIKEAKLKTDPAYIKNNYTDLKQFTNARFLTTNYDEYLNDFIGGKEILLSEFSQIAVNEFARQRYRQAIIPIHGTVSRPESIVFSENSYKKLYDTNEFTDAFQILRHGYTFLFLGFSFDDIYFQSLFKMIIGRFRANHYILFDKSQQANLDKIKKLSKEYGVAAIYYDAGTSSGHVEKIHEYLSQIIHFEDKDIILPKGAVSQLQKEEPGYLLYQEQIKRLEALAMEYKIKPALKGYKKLLGLSEFEQLPEQILAAVYKGLIFCYGVLREFARAEQYYEEAASKLNLPEASEGTLVIFAQTLINAYKWEQVKQLLSKTQKRSRCLDFWYDIAQIGRKILGNTCQPGERIPIYADKDWPPQEKAVRRAEYCALKEKYIIKGTYNLAEEEKYGDIHSREMVYYWLGTIACQVFHEHADAAQYLYRAYQIRHLNIYYEVMGHNYFYLAQEKTRYRQNSFMYELDKDSMMKAKRCFELAMHESDAYMRKSLFKACGPEYLHLLKMLNFDFEFDIAYSRLSRYIEKDYGIYFIKAEHDARYHFRLNYPYLKRLNDEDQLYIRALCLFSKAGRLMEQGRKESGEALFQKIIELLANREDLYTQNRFLLMLMDAAFSAGDISLHKKCLSALQSRGMDLEIFTARELELEGKLEEAQELFLKSFIDVPDVSSFTTLKAYYLRHGMIDHVRDLYELTLKAYADIIYDRDDFYISYIGIMFNSRRLDEAFRLYVRFHEQIVSPSRLREIEEMLKPAAMDYADCDQRVDFLYQMLQGCPVHVQHQFYHSLMSLYLVQFRFDEAEQVLSESGYPSALRIIIHNGIEILRAPQDPSKYIANRRLVFSSDFMPFYQQLLHQNQKYEMYCCGHSGEAVIVPMILLLLLLYERREPELLSFSKIYLAYAGIIRLQNSLVFREDSFIRYALRWLMQAQNIEPFAPELYQYCLEFEAASGNRDPERLQIQAYHREHPDISVVMG